MSYFNKEVIWIDNARAISTIAVILLHVSAGILHEYNNIPILNWHIGNIFDSSVRFSVPVFFMISGALILSKDYLLFSFLKKRVLKILPPLLFWSLIYSLFNNFIFKHKPIQIDRFLEIIGKNLLNGSEYHLWFVYTILGIYLFAPILRKWIKHSNNTEIKYFLVIWLISTLYNKPYNFEYLPNIEIVNFSGLVGYFVLGYYLLHFNKKNNFIFIVLIIIGTTSTILGTYFTSLFNGYFKETFYSAYSINVIISSVGVFLLLKNIEIKNQHIQNCLLAISKYSYGIYLVHVLVLNCFEKINLNWTIYHPILSIPLVTILCLFVSYSIIFLLRKITNGEKLFG